MRRDEATLSQMDQSQNLQGSRRRGMKKLSECLNELANRVSLAEQEIAAAQQETGEKVEARIKEARADAKSRQDAFEDGISEGQAAVVYLWRELQADYHTKLDKIKGNIETKKEARERKRAVRRADDAEKYAAAAIDFACIAVAEAEVAVLEAIEAQSYAKSLT
jgi:hypothetical protein